MHIFIYKWLKMHRFACAQESNWEKQHWGRGMTESLITKLNCIKILLWCWQNNLFLHNLSYERIHVNVNITNERVHVDHHFHTWSENKLKKLNVWLNIITNWGSVTQNISYVSILYFSSPNALAHYQHANHAFVSTSCLLVHSEKAYDIMW